MEIGAENFGFTATEIQHMFDDFLKNPKFEEKYDYQI